MDFPNRSPQVRKGFGLFIVEPQQNTQSLVGTALRWMPLIDALDGNEHLRMVTFAKMLNLTRIPAPYSIIYVLKVLTILSVLALATDHVLAVTCRMSRRSSVWCSLQ